MVNFRRRGGKSTLAYKGKDILQVSRHTHTDPGWRWQEAVIASEAKKRHYGWPLWMAWSHVIHNWECGLLTHALGCCQGGQDNSEKREWTSQCFLGVFFLTRIQRPLKILTSCFVGSLQKTRRWCSLCYHWQKIRWGKKPSAEKCHKKWKQAKQNTAPLTVMTPIKFLLWSKTIITIIIPR